MKRATAFILLAMITLMLCACQLPKEEKREAIATRFFPEHDSIETTNQYAFDALNFEFRLMPNTRSVHYSDAYEVQYRIHYDNGNTIDKWVTVDKGTYEEAEAALKEVPRDG